MIISNAKVFSGGKFIDGGIDFDEKIIETGSAVSGGIDAKGCYIIPGLIDIHTHAAVGADASDADAEGMEKMSLYYAAKGVTSWLPTTMTLKEPELTAAVKVIRDFKRPEKGAKAPGINLEGPFVNYEKRGAQNGDNIHVPDAAMFKRLNDASGGIVKIITIAPEEPGAIECIKEIRGECTVSLGHTTTDYATAMKAFEAGASHTTHLFNAMPPLAHRAPGLIGAASDAGATVELITDGLHIDPAVVRLTYRLFGEKLVLISDSLRCAGMPDGEYELGGQPIEMKNGKATLKGTDTLAGSSIHLLDGLKRAVSFGIPLEAAVTAATITPAKAIKMDSSIGSLEKGKSADFIILDKDLDLKAVYINGKQIV